MNCPKCKKEVPEDAKFCPFCGETISIAEESKEAEEKEQKNETEKETKKTEPEVTNEAKEEQAPKKESTKFEPLSGVKDTTFKPKKKSKLGLIIFILILLVALIGGAAYYYFMVYTNPTKIYKGFIEKAISKSLNSTEEINTINSTVKLNADLDLEDDILDEDIIDLINNIELSLNTQMDKENKQMVVKLDSNYEKEELLNLEMYVDVNKEKTYLYAKEFIDKYLEIPETNIDYESLSELFTTESMTFGEKVSLEKIKKILSEEFTSIIKDEYCSKETDGLDNTYILKINAKQLMEELKTILKNLKDNNEFIECFEEKDDVKDTLEDLLDQLDEQEPDEDVNLIIKVYTTGIKQKVSKISAEVTDEEEKIFAEVKIKEEGIYEYTVSSNDEKICDILLKINKKDDTTSNFEIKISIPEMGSITLKFETSFETGKEIDKVDDKKVKSFEDLTENDIENIMTKIEKSKIYELISEFSGGNISLPEMNEDDEEDNNTSMTTKENEIITYDETLKVSFDIPEELEAGYASDTYKAFSNDDLDITIKSQSSTTKQYLESKDSTLNYYKQQSYYKDVELSDIKEIEVSGRTFYYREMKYKYVIGNSEYEYTDMYICGEIGEDNIYIVEISSEDAQISSNMLNKLLNIKISK